MKLYYAPRTHATRARWLLEELEIPYELVRLDLVKGENRHRDFLAVNPLGEVPVLVDDDTTLTEPAAIALHLADRFPEAQFAPKVDAPERAEYLQWLLFAECRLAPMVVAFTQYDPHLEGAELAFSEYTARLGELLSAVERQLKGGDFLVAGRFTAADLVTASLLHLAFHRKQLDGRPTLVRYVTLHSQRPAARRAVS